MTPTSPLAWGEQAWRLMFSTFYLENILLWLLGATVVGFAAVFLLALWFDDEKD